MPKPKPVEFVVVVPAEAAGVDKVKENPVEEGAAVEVLAPSPPRENPVEDGAEVTVAPPKLKGLAPLVGFKADNENPDADVVAGK